MQRSIKMLCKTCRKQKQGRQTLGSKEHISAINNLYFFVLLEKYNLISFLCKKAWKQAFYDCRLKFFVQKVCAQKKVVEKQISQDC